MKRAFLRIPFFVRSPLASPSEQRLCTENSSERTDYRMTLFEKIVLALAGVALLLLASDAAFNLFSAITRGSFR
jgi:hypothetical protein